jgi:hypothetical protein
MPFASGILPSDPFRESWTRAEEGGLVKHLCKASEFVRGLRTRLRFGQLSRAPLGLLRLQIVDNVVECEWMARSADPWDADLSRSIQQRHASIQTLRDAIDIRALLFELMPQLETVYLRTYRRRPDDERELIIEGCTQRNDHAARNVHSLVMRAKILGFRFDIEGNALRNIAVAGSCVQVGSWKTSKWGSNFS